jgi:hypothetical protein
MKTVVIGASTNPERYSYKAVNMLLQYKYEVVPFGIKKGAISGIEIINEKIPVKDVHTVTMYVGKDRQEEYYDYIINILKPKRIIFNPGTENDKLVNLAREKNIETHNYCTLVLLSTGQYTQYT